MQDQRLVSNMFNWVNDPGHGGKDRSNKGYSGVYVEADGTLSISQAMQWRADQYRDVQMQQTRTDDTSISLTERGMMGAGKDLFTSIHTNGFSNPSASGVEVYYSVDILEDKELAQRVCDVISKRFLIPNRGAKLRKSTDDPTEDYFTVMDRAQDNGCKHVLLIEPMFHSNSLEEDMLLDQKIITILGELIVDTIAAYFGLADMIDLSEVTPYYQSSWVKAVRKGVEDGLKPKEVVTAEKQMAYYNKLGLLD